jgi:hypothetical protein
LDGKPEGSRLLGRPSNRWKDNNNVDVKEVGWKSVNLINLDQDRDHRWALVNT